MNAPGSASIPILGKFPLNNPPAIGDSTTPSANQPVTLTARVTPGYGEIATVSGNVTFKDGSRYLGTVSLQGRTASITTQFAA